MQGTVKWFSSEKGYGFITSEDGEDHYFNVQSINGALLPSNGDSVQFESKSGNKGPRAINITITAKAPSQNIRPADDRINCPSCGKKIVPRLITYRGSPEKSVCPYCAATVKTFSKCFIATAVYGDPSCYQVRELRKYRDNSLLKNVAGRIFVNVYYKVSPAIADWLITKPTLSGYIRAVLNFTVKHITNASSGRSKGAHR
ncbi:cold shock domain-containing protein [Aeromonas veronii]|uniref:cold shock domain-containing protein n=1 Tax=Aeromonas veronii TaxID=654 RepID=UPI0030044720